jgi:hypothetical protein
VQNRAKVALSSSTYQVPASATAATITVNRSGSSAGTASVSYTTVNGTAQAGTDYVAIKGTLNWEDGDTTPKTFAIPLKTKGKIFNVSLTSSSGEASLGSPAQATVQTSTTSSASSSSGSSSGGSSTSSSSSGSTAESGSSSGSGTASSSSGTTSSTQSLLSYLNGLSSQSSRHLLIGQHTDYWVNGAAAHMANVTSLYTQTGQNPAILGTTIDMLYSDEDGVSLSNAWLARGGIVQVSWWAGNPALGVGPGDCTNLSINFADLLDPSTQAYKNWYATLDQVAAQLKQINGPVLFRPFLELNGNWYWWGNQDPAKFIQVWKNMHDYLVNTKGVTNLLWEYCVNAGVGNYTTYYPGANYVDVVAMDAYPPGSAALSMYNALVPLNKPLVFAEAGGEMFDGSSQNFTLDDNAMLQEVLTAFPKVVGMVVWEGVGSLVNQNGAQQVMNSSSAISLADLPSGL